MTNPIKKFKILQDYRTLDFFIPKGTVLCFNFGDEHVRYKGENGYCHFTLSEIISNPNWFQEVPLDYEGIPEFKVGDVVVNDRGAQFLITWKYNEEDLIYYKLGDGSTYEEKDLIRLCSKL